MSFINLDSIRKRVVDLADSAQKDAALAADVTRSHPLFGQNLR